MGIADFFSDLYSSMGFPEAHADAPPEDDDSKEGGDDDKSEGEGDEKAEGGDEEGGEAGGDEEGGEEEAEEEEEEEPVDPKPQLEEGEFAGANPFPIPFCLRLTLLCFFYRLCPLRAVLSLETPLRRVCRARNLQARTSRPVQGIQGGLC